MSRRKDAKQKPQPSQPAAQLAQPPQFQLFPAFLRAPVTPFLPFVHGYQTCNFPPAVTMTHVPYKPVTEAESPPPPEQCKSKESASSKQRTPTTPVMVQVVDLREDSDDPVDELVPSSSLLPQPEVILLDDEDDDDYAAPLQKKTTPKPATALARKQHPKQSAAQPKKSPQVARPAKPKSPHRPIQPRQPSQPSTSSASKQVAAPASPPAPAQAAQPKKKRERPSSTTASQKKAKPVPAPEVIPPTLWQLIETLAALNALHSGSICPAVTVTPSSAGTSASSSSSSSIFPRCLAPNAVPAAVSAHPTPQQPPMQATVSSSAASTYSSTALAPLSVLPSTDLPALASPPAVLLPPAPRSSPNPTAPLAPEATRVATPTSASSSSLLSLAPTIAVAAASTTLTSDSALAASTQSSAAQSSTKRKSVGKNRAGSTSSKPTQQRKTNGVRAPSPAATQLSASHELMDDSVFLMGKGRGAESELVPDEFDVESTIPSKQRTCAFCNRGHEEGVKLQDYLGSVEEAELVGDASELDDPEGVWVSRFPLMIHRKSRSAVHVVCALWAPLTVRKQGQWFNVAREVRRARQLKCKHCGQKGAAIGCAIPTCPYSIHFPCALEQGWTPSTFAAGVNPYYCLSHAAQRRADRIAEDKKCAKDIARGRELIPVLAADEESAAQLKQEFTYISRLVDSDEYTMPTNATKVQCCSCTDGCTDFTRCACLQRMQGKAYTSLGLLLEPRPALVVECGLRCRCHIADCTNRVVSRGLCHSLQVCKGGDGEWQLRTLKPIPQGAFVMEFIGQAVLGRSVLDALQRRDPAVCVIRRWEETVSPLPTATELDVEVCIDARRYGNAARFVRFSEHNPNLQRVNVFGGPHDPMFPRLAYFSSREIKQGEVLTAPPPSFL